MLQRLHDMIHGQPADSPDERSSQAERLTALDADLRETTADLKRANVELHDLATGATRRLASYRRVHLGR